MGSPKFIKAAINVTKKDGMYHVSGEGAAVFHERLKKFGHEPSELTNGSFSIAEKDVLPYSQFRVPFEQAARGGAALDVG